MIYSKRHYKRHFYFLTTSEPKRHKRHHFIQFPCKTYTQYPQSYPHVVYNRIFVVLKCRFDKRHVVLNVV